MIKTKKDKKATNDLQNTTVCTQTTKDRATRTRKMYVYVNVINFASSFDFDI
jgi:hypothetical protein